MSIPIEFVVDVQVTRQDLALGISGFGILNIVGISTVISPQERIRFYTSIDGVVEDFGELSEESKAATVFFEQTPHAETLAISRRLLADTKGFAISNPVTAIVGDFIAVSDGSFEITIDGVPEDIIALDFSSDTTFDNVASTIESALNAIGAGGYSLATVDFNGVTKKFTITSGTTGALSTVSLLTTVSPASGTDISDSLFMNMQTGVTVDGADFSGSVTGELDAIQAANAGWYGLMFTKELRDIDATTIEIANWVEARIKLFVNVTNNSDVINSAITNDIMSQLKALNFARTTTIFEETLDFYPNPAEAAIMFAVDFTGIDTTKTLEFKTLKGIPVDNLTTNEMNTLIAKNGVGYVIVGKSDVVKNSVMANGEFFDIVHGADWLVETIKANTFSVLTGTPTKIPYTDAGIEQLVQKGLRVPLSQGVTNGFLAAQTDDDGNVIPAFTVNVPLVVDIPLSDRSARRVTGITFTALLAGAIHFVRITGTLTLGI